MSEGYLYNVFSQVGTFDNTNVTIPVEYRYTEVQSRDSPKYPILQANPYYKNTRHFEMITPGILLLGKNLKDAYGRPTNQLIIGVNQYNGAHQADLIDTSEWDSQRKASHAKLYKKLADQKANLLDIARTYVESRNMVVARLMQLIKAAQALRRLDLRGVQSALHLRKPPKLKEKKFSRQWLELSYGWAPLLSDIYQITTDMFSTRLGFIRGKTIWVKDIDRTFLVNGGMAEARFRGTQKTVITAAVFAELDQGLIKSASQYGLTNPALVAWESVPWSFVVDWVLPVGDWLESLSALHGLIISNASVTTRSEVTGTMRIERSRYPNDYRIVQHGAIKVSNFKMHRGLGIDTPPPPSFDSDFLSPLRGLNAIALLRQTLSKRD